ncbi:MAG: OPT/YSL family transporter [Kiritimatiellia bacterium]|nr:OPT/YSL family transporter [Kiritimatiellia bacterium]
MREDKEFREFRDLMPRPDKFSDGFKVGTILMGLFVGFVMAPASVYMNLVAGLQMGEAAKWVTVLLYVEIMRRAFKKLKRPEIFVLFYMCGAAMAAGGEGFLWRQFLVQSDELRKMGLTGMIPAWYAPADAGEFRSFFRAAWAVPLGLTALMMLFQRIDHFGLGYVMFRLTADVEELPFPMAPVGAAGMTALADSSDDRETWRYRVFAMGAALGIAFGFIYLAVPSITGAVFSKPMRPLPIPFLDLTRYTEGGLPAMPMMLSFDLGLVITGMVMPFWAVMGSLFGVIFTMVVNPLLQGVGVLASWEPGMSAMETVRTNTFDFYFSFNLGLTFAVAIIGFLHMKSKFDERKQEMDETGRTQIRWRDALARNRERGDIPIWVGLLIYLVSTLTYITLTYILVNELSPVIDKRFPLLLLLFYGFIYTPVMSYISARMEGIVGMQMNIPFVKEATFIMSGYKGAAIWFAPIPMHNYANQVRSFRVMELTGTKLTSLLKAEVLTYPLMLIGTVLFAQFIWSLGPVPSEMFPFANEFWELRAYNNGLMWSATLPDAGISPFRDALRLDFIGSGLGVALMFYAVLARFNLPVFLVYGLIRGLDQSLPHMIIPTITGAFIGRFWCRKRFGDNWPRYRIVFAAGFGAGMGLITMFALGCVFMAKSANVLPV